MIVMAYRLEGIEGNTKPKKAFSRQHSKYIYANAIHIRIRHTCVYVCKGITSLKRPSNANTLHTHMPTVYIYVYATYVYT